MDIGDPAAQDIQGILDFGAVDDFGRIGVPVFLRRCGCGGLRGGWGRGRGGMTPRAHGLCCGCGGRCCGAYGRGCGSLGACGAHGRGHGCSGHGRSGGRRSIVGELFFEGCDPGEDFFQIDESGSACAADESGFEQCALGEGETERAFQANQLFDDCQDGVGRNAGGLTAQCFGLAFGDIEAGCITLEFDADEQIPEVVDQL